MTPDELDNILAMPRYNRLAMEWALDNQMSSDRWWDLHSAVTDYQTKIAIWEAAQNIIMLFEAYPHEIETIELLVSTDNDSSGMGISSTVLINGFNCENTYNEMDADTLDRMTSVDDQFVFKRAINSLTSCFDERMLPYFNQVEAAFNQEFTSPPEVRVMIKKFAQEAEAGIKAILLEQVALNNSRNTPASGTAGTKNRPGR